MICPTPFSRFFLKNNKRRRRLSDKRYRVRRVRLKVWGIVQGVGFRFFVERVASELNLKGFVRNDPEGTVTIEAEGREEALQKFVGLCKRGPRSAKIEKIDITWEDKIKGYKDFSVRY